MRSIALALALSACTTAGWRSDLVVSDGERTWTEHRAGRCAQHARPDVVSCADHRQTENVGLVALVAALTLVSVGLAVGGIVHATGA